VRIRARTVAAETEVRAALAAAGPWPGLTVTGTTVIGVDVPDDERAYWSLALADLVDEVEDRPPTGATDDRRTSVVIAAPSDEVFDSLIDQETFERWYGRPLKIDLYEGGNWSIEGGPAGTVGSLVADRRLVLADDTATLGWDLSEVDEGTTLTMAMRGGTQGEWLGWLCGLTQLRRLHEVPDRCPIWVTADES